jgi:hydrogenase expression/formation protein HypC
MNAAAEAIAEVNFIERESLQSSCNPIVLMRSLEENDIASAVTSNLRSIGVMLPSSTMHAMLIDATQSPLVVTSDNVHGCPLIYENVIASSELCDIADIFLHHDREIVRPIDDSVVQCFGDQMTTRPIDRRSGMCLGVPGKIVRWINHDPTFAKAEVAFADVRREVHMACVPNAVVGQYVIVHAGIAICVVNESEAEKTIAAFESLAELDDETS